MKKSVALLSFFSLIFLSSCGVIMQKAMGINTIQAIPQESIQDLGIEYGIKEGNVYAIDTQSFKTLIRSVSHNPRLKNDLGQPMQVLTFDAAGQSISHIVNCYCGGAPNLNWHSCLKLDSFPLSSRTGARVDTSLSLSQWKSHFRLLDNNSTHSAAPEMTIVVFWNRWMGKQSRRLIHETQAYRSRFADKGIALVWVNTDDLYVR